MLIACCRCVLAVACKALLCVCVVVSCFVLFAYRCRRAWLFVVVLCVCDDVFFVVCLLFGIVVRLRARLWHVCVNAVVCCCWLVLFVVYICRVIGYMCCCLLRGSFVVCGCCVL